jgi:hypothetical protein
MQSHRSPRALGTLLAALVIWWTALSGHASAQCTMPAASAQPGILLDVADGQFRTGPLRVFVNRAIVLDDDPQLRLFDWHAVTVADASEGEGMRPLFAASNQQVSIEVDGNRVAICGTIFYFDLSRYHIEFYKPARRVLPVVSWNSSGDPKVRQFAVARNPINLGQPVQAIVWTAMLMSGLVAWIITLNYPAGHRLRQWWPGRRPAGAVPAPAVGPGPAMVPFCLLCSDDGHLSLSKVQIAGWTLATAAAILFYGMLRFSLPSIPDSLVVLMGLALATGGASYLAPPPRLKPGSPNVVPTDPTGVQPLAPAAAMPVVQGEPPALHAPGVPPAPPIAADPGSGTNPVPLSGSNPSVVPKLSDLLLIFPSNGPPQLSLARCQMLVWTVVLIFLFLCRTVLNGTLWNIPWEMVTLTGISQVGYLGPKYAGPLTNDSADSPPGGR